MEVRKRQGVDVRFIADGDLGHIDREVAVCLFRMAQEALRNGLVHGSARHLVVSLARSRGDIELTVTDDGAGFDPEAVRRNGSGLGLVSMEERAYALGGDVRRHELSRPGDHRLRSRPCRSGDRPGNCDDVRVCRAHRSRMPSSRRWSAHDPEARADRRRPRGGGRGPGQAPQRFLRRPRHRRRRPRGRRRHCPPPPRCRPAGSHDAEYQRTGRAAPGGRAGCRDPRHRPDHARRSAVGGSRP